MITVICGTNRKKSKTLFFARQIVKVFKDKTLDEIKLLALEDLPTDFLYKEMYTENGQSSNIAEIQNEYLIPAEKLLIISPEYNGSFPGVLKTFIDACSIRAYKATFKGKKVCLVGVSSGRAGNLRGMEHLTGILNHVGAIVMPNKLPISEINKLANQKGEIINQETLTAIEKQVEEFVVF